MLRHTRRNAMEYIRGRGAAVAAHTPIYGGSPQTVDNFNDLRRIESNLQRYYLGSIRLLAVAFDAILWGHLIWAVLERQPRLQAKKNQPGSWF